LLRLIASLQIKSNRACSPLEACAMEKASRRLVPDSEVCARYGVHISTLYNWDRNPALDFPKPIRINKRKFRDERELDAFDRARAAERQTAA
jgi:predicted DNA-binding transcriptional regulator AlpA